MPVVQIVVHCKVCSIILNGSVILTRGQANRWKGRRKNATRAEREDILLFNLKLEPQRYTTVGFMFNMFRCLNAIRFFKRLS